MSRSVIAIILFNTLACWAADYLPLQTGNRWVYRATNGQTHTIAVGLPLGLVDGRTYFRVSGYTPKPEWIRRLADGALAAYNEETGEDVPLIAFDKTDRWTRSWLAPCEQEAQPQERRVPHQGPAGRFDAALEMKYRSFICADVGLESERYLDNIGLLQRVTTTIAGPVRYDLVYARVGNVEITGERGSAARLELPATITRLVASEPVTLRATLRLTVDGEPLRLRFGTSQRTDFAITDEQGREVFKWSDRASFAQVLGEEIVSRERSYTLEGVLAGLPDGRYTVSAWIATAHPFFAATAAFELKSENQPAN